MKDQLIFDVTNASTILDSDSVGAFLRASDGTLLTHTDVGGKKALDVRMAEGINVEVDLSHVDDSVRLGDGTTLFTGTTVGGDTGLDVNLINASIAVTQSGTWNIGTVASITADVNIADGGNSITVDAVNLDIRDLTHVSDSIKIGDGTDFLAVAADGSIAITDNGGSLTVDAVNLDIRDLTAATDSVSSWLKDGTGTAITSTGGAIDVNIASGSITTSDAALAATAVANATLTLAVADTAQNIVTSPLSNRKYLWVYNKDNRKVFIGSTGVTAANGFPMSPGSYMELRAGAAVDIEFVGSTGKTPEIRTLELS